jgi:hypothetical protein
VICSSRLNSQFWSPYELTSFCVVWDKWNQFSMIHLHHLTCKPKHMEKRISSAENWNLGLISEDFGFDFWQAILCRAESPHPLAVTSSLSAQFHVG